MSGETHAVYIQPAKVNKTVAIDGMFASSLRAAASIEGSGVELQTICAANAVAVTMTAFAEPVVGSLCQVSEQKATFEVVHDNCRWNVAVEVDPNSPSDEVRTSYTPVAAGVLSCKQEAVFPALAVESLFNAGFCPRVPDSNGATLASGYAGRGSEVSR